MSYYQKNRERLLAYGKRYYLENRTERLEYGKDYYHKNKAKIQKRKRRRKKLIKAYNHEYYIKYTKPRRKLDKRV